MLIQLASPGLFASTFNFLSNSHLGELVELSKEIKSICPRKDCIFIGVGASPTFINALLEKIQNTSVVHLPLSRFRYNPYGDYSLNPKQVQSLYEHFDKVFASEDIKLNQLRNVLVLDYAQSGKSLAAASSYLGLYLKKNNIESSINSVLLGNSYVAGTHVITDEKIVSLANAYKINKPFNIEIDRYPEVMATFKFQIYDSFRKYGSFNIKDFDGYSYQKSDEYMKLTKEMNQRIIYSESGLRLKKNLKNSIGSICQWFLRPFN